MNLYCTDSASRISTAQTRAPNKSLLCRLWLQMNLYCTDSGSKLISTVQTWAPNESLLCRLGLQTNPYCAVFGSKLISTAQILAPNGLGLYLWTHTKKHDKTYKGFVVVLLGSYQHPKDNKCWSTSTPACQADLSMQNIPYAGFLGRDVGRPR